MDSSNRPAVGLDFGTSTTLVADRQGVRPIGRDQAWMPSVVGCDDDGRVVVGEPALDLSDALAEQAVRSIKRAITDRRESVRIATPDGIRDMRADDLMAAVLQEAAGRAVGVQLSGDGLRIGCPAMWDGSQRRRLLSIAERAGIPAGLANLVDEPVAAGIAWLAVTSGASSEPMRILVFDMGGGTLDVAILDVRGISHRDVSVLAALGVAEAGDALDRAIADDLEHLLGEAGANPPDSAVARQHLLRAAREAKEGLSVEDRFPVSLPKAVFGTSVLWYTREQLNAVFAAQMDRAELAVIEALKQARITEMVAGSAYDIVRAPVQELVKGVDVVVLSGGMAHIPYVEERLRNLFPSATVVGPASAPPGYVPEHAVAVGLANAQAYGRINMFRPAFDIVLEWDGEIRTVYDAYTPLFERWQIARGGSELGYHRNGLDLGLPRAGKGRLRVISHTETPVRATLGGESLDGFPVALSEQRFRFYLSPTGQIRLVDDVGTHEGRIDDWHAMVGHDHAQRVARLAEPPTPDIPVEYPFNMERTDPFAR